MTRTKTTDARKIEAVAARNGWTYYRAYSGRCMFGATCPGVVCDPSEVKAVRAAVKRAGVKGEASGDSMGRDSIVYWPFVASDPEAEGATCDEIRS